jgi:transposase
MPAWPSKRSRLIAPTDGEALRGLLRPGQDLRLGRTPAVLWLDDLEPFLNQGTTLQTLREWQAPRPGRIVTATYGGKGSEQIADATVAGVAAIAADVLTYAREVPLAITSAAELGELRGQLDDAQLQAIGRHGLAAFLVVGPALERQLTTHHAKERARMTSRSYTRRTAIRSRLRRSGVKATIPEPADQVRNRLRRGSRGGRPPAFDAAAYKQRNVVERASCQLRQHRAVATRYDKRDFVWRGTADVASIRIWLRRPVS